VTLSIAALTRTIATAAETNLSTSRALVVISNHAKPAQQKDAAPTTNGATQVDAKKVDDAKPPVVATSVTPEIIAKSYVTVTSVNANKTLSSILLASVNNLLRASHPRVYSLLNWKAGERPADLEVTSYNRVAHFGKWAQDRSDKTCYNTRAKVLIRDSVKPVIFSEGNACSVDKGEWDDPYAGKVLTDAKAEIQIDHMVPLKNAYISGAYKWDFRARCLYANYLGVSFHLISVDGVENQRKGDKSPEGYMPSNKAYACTYLKNWLTVKTLWGLEMTPAEADGIKKLIASEGCKPEDFVISEDDLQAQRKFAAANADLCGAKPPATAVSDTQPVNTPTPADAASADNSGRK